MKLTHAQKAEMRELARERVRRRNRAGLCGRCGLEPRKVRDGKPLVNGAACIAKETERVQGKRLAAKARRERLKKD